MTEAVHDNLAWGAASPRLSVLIPFLGDDPGSLLVALESARPQAIELILLDDGTGDPALTAAVKARLDALPFPSRLISLSVNVGRAAGRNRLFRAARADHLLFLDSDMLPDSQDFLDRWLELAAERNPPVAFGGFSLAQASRARRYAVHRSLAERSECLDAAARALAPEKYVYTSNLLVRRDVFEAEAFDAGFVGWGWEDVEWAMRVSRRWPILHIDNPATHMGLDEAATLARKYEQSAVNFGRVAERHPDVVATYPSHRVARRLKLIPGLGAVRGLVKRLALWERAPTPMRAFSLRLYRAALYADQV